MGELGEFLGFLTAGALLVAIVSTLYAGYLKNHIAEDEKYEKRYNLFHLLHRIGGFVAALALIAHMVVQLIFAYLSISGLITAILVVLQVLLGVFIAEKNPTGKFWMFAHKYLPILIILAFLVHFIFRF